MNGWPDYLLYLLVDRLFVKAALARLLGFTCRNLLELPRLRRAAEGNFRRIHSRVHGREPTPDETASFRGEMSRLMARETLSQYEALRDAARFEAPADLPLMPALQDLLRLGRGVVLVTPHFGDTTMLFFGLARAGLSLHVMVNRIPPASAEALAATRLKLYLSDLGTGAKYHLDALRRNELVLLFSDIDYFPGGRTLDFFGAPFNPPHGPARLALAAGAPILPVYTVWDGTRHQLLCDAPIATEGADQEAIEKGILLSMERFIGRYPAHWLVYRDPWDLEACARETRRQLRQFRMLRWVDGLWRRVTSGL